MSKPDDSQTTITAQGLLGPISLTCYGETLLLNLAPSTNKSVLSLKKLEGLQSKHLSFMGITNFEHQRMVIKRVKEVLNPATKSAESAGEPPESASALTSQLNQAVPSVLAPRPPNATSSTSTSNNKQRRSMEKKELTAAVDNAISSFDFDESFRKIAQMKEATEGGASKKLDGLRRRSFDAGNAPKESSDAAVIASANTNRERTERKSLSKREVGMVFNTPSENAASDIARKREAAKRYGDSAQKLQMADNGLHKAGLKALRTFQMTVRASRASIIFLDPGGNDMFFYLDDGAIVRFAMDKGIAAWVANNGRILNIPDAYADPRFNSKVDKQTGFKTRSIICAPVRSKTGEGILCVIQLLNKNGDNNTSGEEFTSEDENAIETCASKVAEALDQAFGQLTGAQQDLLRS